MMCPLPSCYNNSVHFTVFEKTQKSLIQHLASQTVLPDRSILKEKKLVENSKILIRPFSVIFKLCVIILRHQISVSFQYFKLYYKVPDV